MSEEICLQLLKGHSEASRKFLRSVGFSFTLGYGDKDDIRKSWDLLAGYVRRQMCVESVETQVGDIDLEITPLGQKTSVKLEVPWHWSPAIH